MFHACEYLKLTEIDTNLYSISCLHVNAAAVHHEHADVVVLMMAVWMASADVLIVTGSDKACHI